MVRTHSAHAMTTNVLRQWCRAEGARKQTEWQSGIACSELLDFGIIDLRKKLWHAALPRPSRKKAAFLRSSTMNIGSLPHQSARRTPSGQTTGISSSTQSNGDGIQARGSGL